MAQYRETIETIECRGGFDFEPALTFPHFIHRVPHSSKRLGFLDGGLIQRFHGMTRRRERDLTTVCVTLATSMVQTPMEFVDGMGGTIQTVDVIGKRSRWTDLFSSVLHMLDTRSSRKRRR